MHELWPPFGIRIVTPRLELRLPTDSELPSVIAAARQLDVGTPYPFTTDWIKLESPAFERGVLQHYWQARAELTSDKWHLPFVVWVDGEPIGVQGVTASSFSTVRMVDTGSWLVNDMQGRGFGVEMREAVLHFCFEGLGARLAVSGARLGNEASMAVSRRVGYVENGLHPLAWGDGTGGDELGFRLDRAVWLEHRRDDIELHGVGPCLAMLGADEAQSR